MITNSYPKRKWIIGGYISCNSPCVTVHVLMTSLRDEVEEGEEG